LDRAKIAVHAQQNEWPLRRGACVTTAAASVASATNLFSSLADRVALSSGWRRKAIGCVSGAIGALALPPFSLVGLMVVPMTFAVWLIDGACDSGGTGRFATGLRTAFGAGWWMGLGYFVCGLWWVGSAVLVDAEKFAWALPLAVIALPAGLAVFPALGFAAARLLWSTSVLRIFALAFGLGVSEWARGLLFTGFPWNDIGMAFGANLTLAQIASIVGLHGLTFLTIAICAAPATLWRAAEKRPAFAPTIAAALALSLIAGFGAVRLAAPASATVVGVKLRLIQPNVSQGASFAPENGEAILRHYLAMSDRPTNSGRNGVGDVTHLIWPESAFPFILSKDAQALGDIAALLRPGAMLITGAARMETSGGDEPSYYNSIEVLDRDGLRPERYDKQHLVPFGEYVPFESMLESAGVTQFVQVPGGFTRGSGPRILDIPGLPTATPLICYEAIFPVEIGDVLSGASRPGWMLNVTDDAWFGLTPGPYQHFAQARLRSIELGLPLVRVANSGVSAVVDGFGREIVVAPLGAEAVLDAELPRPLPPTWQSRFGSVGAAIIAAALLVGGLIGKLARGDRRLHARRLARGASIGYDLT
jgi:apolipoprotein N-acyltransferase